MVSAVKLRRNQLIVSLCAQGKSTADVVAELRRVRLPRVSVRQVRRIAKAGGIRLKNPMLRGRVSEPMLIGLLLPMMLNVGLNYGHRFLLEYAKQHFPWCISLRGLWLGAGRRLPGACRAAHSSRHTRASGGRQILAARRQSLTPCTPSAPSIRHDQLTLPFRVRAGGVGGAGKLQDYGLYVGCDHRRGHPLRVQRGRAHEISRRGSLCGVPEI